ncbi:MAG: helix-turn-helix transcriptional regulator [Clostridia bacterium]|nr:helix-turn-helix transcriptional regulator [Clostridia bacterium]
MFKDIDKIKLIDIICAESARKKSVQNRASHSFTIKLSGKSIYSFKDFTIPLSEGEVLFIPKSSSYDLSLASDKSEYVAIHFDAEIHDAVPVIYSLSKHSETLHTYRRMARLWMFEGSVGKYKCYSYVYNLLAFISSKEQADYPYVKHYKKIENAIEYLQTNIFNCNLTVEELCRFCDISDAYFRKIFKANFRTTPQAYIINKRLEQAENILISGEYDSIGSVALSVGYDDPLYFSRVFTKKFGICPSEYITVMRSTECKENTTNSA